MQLPESRAILFSLKNGAMDGCINESLADDGSLLAEEVNGAHARP